MTRRGFIALLNGLCLSLFISKSDGPFREPSIQEAIEQVSIVPPPIADFTFSPAEPGVGEWVQFIDQSRTPEGKIVSWRWDFGDGTISQQPNPRHIYTRAGEFQVTLMVVNDAALDSQATRTIRVTSVLTASFIYTVMRITEGWRVQFVDASVSDPLDPITSWEWNFGDGYTSHEQNPVHVYTKAGVWVPSLIVTTQHGNQTSAAKIITLRESLSL